MNISYCCIASYKLQYLFLPFLLTYTIVFEFSQDDFFFGDNVDGVGASIGSVVGCNLGDLVGSTVGDLVGVLLGGAFVSITTSDDNNDAIEVRYNTLGGIDRI